ncbi:hypothetical protein PR002_g14393, partial [Phytophthora rubi]
EGWNDYRTRHSVLRRHIPTFLAGSMAAVIFVKLDTWVKASGFQCHLLPTLLLRVLEFSVLALFRSIAFRGLFFIWVHDNTVPKTPGFPFVSVSLTTVFVCEMMLPSALSSILKWRFLRYWGNISFSFYLLHSFVLYNPTVNSQPNYCCRIVPAAAISNRRRFSSPSTAIRKIPAGTTREASFRPGFDPQEVLSTPMRAHERGRAPPSRHGAANDTKEAHYTKDDTDDAGVEVMQVPGTARQEDSYEHVGEGGSTVEDSDRQREPCGLHDGAAGYGVDSLVLPMTNIVPITSLDSRATPNTNTQETQPSMVQCLQSGQILGVHDAPAVPTPGDVGVASEMSDRRMTPTPRSVGADFDVSDNSTTTFGPEAFATM